MRTAEISASHLRNPFVSPNPSSLAIIRREPPLYRDDPKNIEIGTVQLVRRIAVGETASPKFTLPVREALNSCWLALPKAEF